MGGFFGGRFRGWERIKKTNIREKIGNENGRPGFAIKV